MTDWRIEDWSVFADHRYRNLAAPDVRFPHFKGLLIRPLRRPTRISARFGCWDGSTIGITSLTHAHFVAVLGDPHKAYAEAFPGARDRLIEACDFYKLRPGQIRTPEPPVTRKKKQGGSGLRR